MTAKQIPSNMKQMKARLVAMSFLQFFIWGAWLLTIGAYWFQTRQWNGAWFGSVFSTMGIASIFMPPIAGMIADRYLNAEKLYGILHLLGSLTLVALPMVNDPVVFFWVMLLNMMFYMPTISLSITVAYSALKSSGFDIITVYPPIRVWGTVGFIAALWVVSLLHLETSAMQFYVSATASMALGIYAFTLPTCKPQGSDGKAFAWKNAFRFEAFALLKNYRMAIFFIFAMLLGAALQLTNAYGDTFLHDFKNIAVYQSSIAVKYPAIIMSISQISETLFILTIPFFLKRFGIKRVMLFSMVAWVLRFGLFAYGNPGNGLWMIILSCVIYGAAFDFFNISGSLFVETQCDVKMRASAQGLFMMMTNGIGAFLGSFISGFAIDRFFTLPDGSKEWSAIWISFAVYALVLAVAFSVLFKRKEQVVNL
jgi:NHS family xanthosine MFS transporter